MHFISLDSAIKPIRLKLYYFMTTIILYCVVYYLNGVVNIAVSYDENLVYNEHLLENTYSFKVFNDNNNCHLV